MVSFPSRRWRTSPKGGKLSRGGELVCNWELTNQKFSDGRMYEKKCCNNYAIYAIIHKKGWINWGIMKKVCAVLSVLAVVSPVFADPEVDVNSQTQNANESPYQMVAPDSSMDGVPASVGYVKSAYNSSIKAVNEVVDTIDSKQNALTSEGLDANVIFNGSGVNVIDVSASDGTITVTKTNETTVPVGSSSASTRSIAWIE